MQKYTINYQKAGGRESFVDYYHAKYKNVIMDKSLLDNVTFAKHDLVKNGSFSKMHIIICRNVMIYFNRDLHNTVFKLFKDSLYDEGFLCLGNKESICFYEDQDLFKELNLKERIFQLNGK